MFIVAHQFMLLNPSADLFNAILGEPNEEIDFVTLRIHWSQLHLSRLLPQSALKSHEVRFHMEDPATINVGVLIEMLVAHLVQ